jgi:hypothetical protein
MKYIYVCKKMAGIFLFIILIAFTISKQCLSQWDPPNSQADQKNKEKVTKQPAPIQVESQSGATQKLIDKELFRKDGNDVLILDEVVRHISFYDDQQPVYVAYGEPPECGSPPGNAWMTPTTIDVSQYKVVKEGEYWRARGMVGIEFNLVQLKNNRPGIRNRHFAALEHIHNKNILIHQDCRGAPRTAIFIPTDTGGRK